MSTRFKKGQTSGSNNAKWKGGIITNWAGYKSRLSPNHPYCDGKGYVKEHRLVMEEFLGRYLKPNEVIHHKNGIRDDNRIENLELTTQNIHASQHMMGNTFGRFLKQDMSNRFCFNCDGKTSVDKHGWARWYKFKNDFLCDKCHGKMSRRNLL